jgi:hypothetical protein
MILGTVGYMSPEQVRGEGVDARTDIFSFGAVLYEMLTGARAFAKNSATETLAAILRDDPPEPETTGRPIPAGLQRIIHHCLEKSPSQRFRSAHDVAFALENLSTGSGVGVAARRPRTRKVPWAAAVVAILTVVAGLAGWLLLGGPPAQPVFHRLTFEQGTGENARFGPDGKTVLYSARWKGGLPTLYSIPAGGLESQRLNVESSTLPRLQGQRARRRALAAFDLRPVSRQSRARSGERRRRAGNREKRSRRRLESPLGGAGGRDGEARRLDARITPREAFARRRGRLPRFSSRDGSLAFFENHLGLGWPPPKSGDIIVLDPAGRARVLANERRYWPRLVREGNEIWFSGGRTAGARFPRIAYGKIGRSGAGPEMSLSGHRIGRPRARADASDPGQRSRPRDGAARESLSIYDRTFSVDFTPDRKALLVNGAAPEAPRGSGLPRAVDGSLPTKLARTREALSRQEARAGRHGRSAGPVHARADRSGPSSVVDLSGISSNQIGRFFPDGKRFVFQGAAEGKPIRLYEVDPGKSDAPKPLTVEGTLVWQGGNPVSPDGKSLFVLKDLGADAVDEIVSIDDGAALPIAGKEPRDIPIRWTATDAASTSSSAGFRCASCLDPGQGERPVKEFMPADPGGITGEHGHHVAGRQDVRLQLPPADLRRTREARAAMPAPSRRPLFAPRRSVGATGEPPPASASAVHRPRE